jgi:hypothetical protein
VPDSMAVAMTSAKIMICPSSRCPQLCGS